MLWWSSPAPAALGRGPQEDQAPLFTGTWDIISWESSLYHAWAQLCHGSILLCFEWWYVGDNDICQSKMTVWGRQLERHSPQNAKSWKQVVFITAPYSKNNSPLAAVAVRHQPTIPRSLKWNAVWGIRNIDFPCSSCSWRPWPLQLQVRCSRNYLSHPVLGLLTKSASKEIYSYSFATWASWEASIVHWGTCNERDTQYSQQLFLQKVSQFLFLVTS